MKSKDVSMKKIFSLAFLVLFSLSVLFLKNWSLAQQTPRTATLQDYWEGKAEWKLVRKLDMASTGWAYGFGAGAHIEIVGNIWYLFSRKYYSQSEKPSYCNNVFSGIEVRKSLDGGKTWSQPVEIITPQEGKAWECAATDGDAYYDPVGNKWHYLCQCLSRVGVWNGCHLERAGTEPMGPFTETHSNPVIPSRSLWNRICNEQDDDCVKIPGGVNKVFDEGTFDIFHYDGNYYFVAFHGEDEAHHGFRSIAKTPDFINWIAGDESQGVPKDAILDLYDALGWRENWNQGGPIGFGAGSILYDNGYYYLISEGADISLGCTPGQNWDWGIFRSRTLTSTSWEQFPAGNPIIYSSKYPERDGQPIPCNPAYARLFKDPVTGAIYLHYTRESVDPNYLGIYIYKLELTNNLLQNADFWKCTAENWQKMPIGSTNLAVYRYPNQSSDGNCYLVTNCGAPACQPGQSVYQDVSISDISSRKIAYGGKFATEGGTGNVTLTIHELDRNHALITSHTTPLTITSEYQFVQKEVVLTSRAEILRFEVYLESPILSNLTNCSLNLLALFLRLGLCFRGIQVAALRLI